MKKRLSGIGLAESLLALGLMALVLLLVTRLLVQINQVNRRANEISWKVTASQMLEGLELDLLMAVEVDLAVAQDAESLRVTTRDISHPDFSLPGSSPDGGAFRVITSYSLDDSKLRRVTNKEGGVSSTVLGKADSFEVERPQQKSFLVSLRKGKETVTRSYRSMTL